MSRINSSSTMEEIAEAADAAFRAGRLHIEHFGTVIEALEQGDRKTAADVLTSNTLAETPQEVIDMREALRKA